MNEIRRNGTIWALAVVALLILGCTSGRNRLTISSIQGPGSVDPERSATYTCNAIYPEREALSYTWSCTAGYLSSSSGQTVTWTAFDTSGSATVTATVRNDLGDSDVQTRTIAINPPVSHLETAPAAMASPAIAGQSPVLGNYEGPYIQGQFGALSQYEAPNGQYVPFYGPTGGGYAEDTGHTETPVYPAESPDNAVENASSDNVEGYTEDWAGSPSRTGWERAARGTGGREYPSGNAEPIGEQYGLGGNVGTLTPAGPYSPGASPFGGVGMGGNAWNSGNDHRGAGDYSRNPGGNPRAPSLSFGDGGSGWNRSRGAQPSSGSGAPGAGQGNRRNRR